MTKARRTVVSNTPPKNILAPESVEQQIARFLSGGGKPQIIPNGVSAEKIVGIKEASDIKAQRVLGGKKGSQAKRGTHYRKAQP